MREGVGCCVLMIRLRGFGCGFWDEAGVAEGGEADADEAVALAGC